jgi:CheY-like chemotaxis protein
MPENRLEPALRRVQACPLPTRDMAGDIPSRRRMLVVDDDEYSCLLLAELIRLSMPGTAVSTAHDGAGGLRLALMVAPSAVILDLGLPILDGIEAAGAIRRALGGSPRLLALSGSARRLIDAAESEMFDACFLKPVDIASLLAALSEPVAPPP